MGGEFVVVLAGWKVGCRTIDLIRLVHAHAGLGLLAAKAAVERVLDGEEVRLSFETADAAAEFSSLAAATGAVVRDGVELVAPSEQYRDSFLRALAEFRAEGLPWWLAEDVEGDFEGFVARRLADATRREDGFVPRTHLWAIVGGEFAGRVSIRHTLNDSLRVEGGHIGYDTVPSFRGRGIATEMLRLALPVARGLGITEVLLTCDDTNVGSIRVIEKNGGVLRDTRELAPDRPRKRYYWIVLP